MTGVSVAPSQITVAPPQIRVSSLLPPHRQRRGLQIRLTAAVAHLRSPTSRNRKCRRLHPSSRRHRRKCSARGSSRWAVHPAEAQWGGSLPVPVSRRTVILFKQPVFEKQQNCAVLKKKKDFYRFFDSLIFAEDQSRSWISMWRTSWSQDDGVMA